MARPRLAIRAQIAIVRNVGMVNGDPAITADTTADFANSCSNSLMRPP